MMEFHELFFIIQILVFFALFGKTIYQLIKDFKAIELAQSIINYLGVGITYLIGFILTIQHPDNIDFVSIFNIENLGFWFYSFLFIIIILIQIKNLLVKNFNKKFY